MTGVEVRVADLTGAALDWAVATCEGLPIRHDPMGVGPGVKQGGYWVWDETSFPPKLPYQLIGGSYSPSQRWDQGGPILEREIDNFQRREGYFYANRFKRRPGCVDINFKSHPGEQDAWAYGPTLLVAAMRTYVMSQKGAVVQVPSLTLEAI